MADKIPANPPRSENPDMATRRLTIEDSVRSVR